MATTIDSPAYDRYTQADLLKLRLEGLPLLLIVQGLSAIAFMLLPLDASLDDRYWAGAASALLALGIYLARRLSAWLVGALFAASTLGFWAAALWLLPGDTVVWLATLVVGAVSALIGPRVAFLAAGLTSVVMVAAAGNGHISNAVMLAGGLVSWVSACLFWLTARPVAVTLEWAWQSYADAREKQDQLRQQRGELNRTVKSLNEAYDRLERVNYELERARQAANQARQLKSQFAVNVSHEIRTPLNLIIGYGEMMVSAPQSYDGQMLPTAYREDAVAIYRNAKHLSDLVDDILDLSQVDAGRMALHREIVPLERIIAEAVETVQVLFAQKGLALTSKLPPQLPPIFADRTRLRQILINLFTNAWRFTDQGGVEVQAVIDDRDFVITVADTGIGIAPEDLPHVFDEFWQGSDPHHQAGGSGVGLALSKRFVEMHNGSVSVSSKVGEGTTFVLTIPRSTTIADMPLPTPWETWARVRAPGIERPSVAVVTKEKDIVALFERYFDNYTIIPLNDVGELSPLLRARAHLDSVVVVEPDALAAHRLALMAELYVPGVPVVGCGLTNSRRSLAERLGVAEYLVKPISRERLKQTLRQLGRPVRRLLVVDDEPDAARLLARMIRSISRKYQVTMAFGGPEALRLLQDDPPDLILLDLIMPKIDGYTLIGKIKDELKLAEVSIVVVSGRDFSPRPLTCDGLVLLQSDGITVSHINEFLRHSLTLLPPGKVVDGPVDRAMPAAVGQQS